MSTTPSALITRAYKLPNILAAGEPLDPGLGQDGLDILNAMLATWRQMGLLKSVTVRNVFALVATKGSPSNPYTVGPTGNLVMARPANQAQIVSVALQFNTPSPVVEVAHGLMTAEEYQGIAVKTITSSVFTAAHYSPTSPLGSLFLWPVPDAAVDSLVLYTKQSLGPFAAITTSFDLPDGYEEAVVYNLAKRLASANGRLLNPDDVEIAKQSLTILKRANMEMSALTNAFASGGGGYDIEAGQ